MPSPLHKQLSYVAAPSHFGHDSKYLAYAFGWQTRHAITPSSNTVPHAGQKKPTSSVMLSGPYHHHLRDMMWITALTYGVRNRCAGERPTDSVPAISTQIHYKVLCWIMCRSKPYRICLLNHFTLLSGSARRSAARQSVRQRRTRAAGGGGHGWSLPHSQERHFALLVLTHSCPLLHL